MTVKGALCAPLFVVLVVGNPHHHAAIERQGVEAKRKALAIAGFKRDSDIGPAGILAVAVDGVEPV